MIASFAMCLRYSFNMVAEADRLEAAIAAVLDEGYRTRDIMSDGMKEDRHDGHGRRHHRKIPRSLGVTIGEIADDSPFSPFGREKMPAGR